MRQMTPHGINRAGQFSRLLAVGAALLLTRGVRGQQFILGNPSEFELTAPQLDKVSGATEARLEQVRALVADRKWDEAVDTLRDVAATDADRLVAVNESTFVPLSAYCQLELSRLPPEGLAAYRKRVDATAEKQYRGGLAARDPAQLGRVVDEAFCSSWGDDALMALGELALERADYAGARRAWQGISPQLRDPSGRLEWEALADVDLSKHWSQVASRWQVRSAAPDWLAYPDTNVDLADVRARLILVSIREGDLDRAKLELEVFRRLHPQSAGRLAGEEGPYAPALERLLKSARDWPAVPRDSGWHTFALAPTRNAAAPLVVGVRYPAWHEPVKLAPVVDHRPVRIRPPGVTGKLQPIRETDRFLAYHPLAVDGRVYFNDPRRIQAVDLSTGKPAYTASGTLYQLDAAPAGEGPAAIGQAIIIGNGRLGVAGVVAGVPRYTMTYANGVLYARMGEDTTGHNQAAGQRRDERLVGIDLRREGLLTFEIKPDDGSWSFDGTPLVEGGRVFVAMRHSDVKPHVFVACFDAATGRRLWRTSIAAGDTPGSGRGEEITHNLLTLVGDRVFINTNLGVVAAIATEDGQIAWMRRYDRAAGTIREPAPLSFDRNPSPCVYDRGMLFVAPADAPTIFALDADTGQTLWATDQLADAANLLGVVEGILIAGGNRLASVDAGSGRVRFIWPESEKAGIRGFGRGVVAGHEVFWPTRDKIYVLDAVTGQQTRNPIDIAAYTNCGANLVAAEGYLLLATHDQLMALGSLRAPPTERIETPKQPEVAITQ
jgi:outer membrane protein assembly factor BamB